MESEGSLHPVSPSYDGRVAVALARGAGLPVISLHTVVKCMRFEWGFSERVPGGYHITVDKIMKVAEH